MPRRVTHGWMLISGLALVAIFLTACSSGSHRETVDKSYFHADQQTDALPLNEFLLNDELDVYAGRLYLQKCMLPQGVTMPLTNPADYHIPTENLYHDSIFGVQVASRYGYHPAGEDYQREPVPDLHLTKTQAADDRSCELAAEKRFFEDPDLEHFIEGLKIEAAVKAKMAPAVTAAVTRWHQCMLPTGVQDLPAAPYQMPSPSLRKRFLDGNKFISPDEIRVAVADARCRQSSGYAKLRYDTEVRIEFQLMDSNASKVNSALASVRQTESAARAYIERYGH
jgi:hypothetical protein